VLRNDGKTVRKWLIRLIIISVAERYALSCLDRLPRQTAPKSRGGQIARPDAGETRLLNSIVAMPIAEMGRALRQAGG